jgi:hypothetical protein
MYWLTITDEELFLKAERKLESRIFIISTYIFWIALLWASTERSETGLGVNFIFLPLQNIFVASNEFKNFPGFELYMIYFCFMLSRLFIGYYTKQSRFVNLFLILTFLVTVINYTNPNNNYSVGFYSIITAKITRSFWIMVPFIYTLLYLKNNVFPVILNKILSIGIIVAALRVVFSLFAVAIGKGQSDLFGRNLSIWQSDILAWVSFFSVFCLTTFLVTKEKKFLWLSILFLLCNFLSYRRTALLVNIASGLIIYLVYIIRINKRLIVLYQFIGVLILVIFAGRFLYNRSSLVFDLTNRYVSAISFTGLASVDETVQGESEYTDSGHLKQSVTSWEFFLNNLDRFWGTGIRVSNSSFWVEGRSPGGVHNNIVYCWSRYGMYMVLYYVIVFITILLMIAKLNASVSVNSANGFMGLSVFIYLALFIVGGWFSGGTFFDNTQWGIQFIFIYSFMKLSSVNQNQYAIVE